MLTITSTAQTPAVKAPSRPSVTRAVAKTACTVGIVVLVTANAASLKAPQRTNTGAPPLFSASHTSNLRYNGNISVVWDGISAMTPEMANSLLRIEEIGRLPDNWNGSGAAAFSRALVGAARALVCALPVQPAILPTARDSIQMEYERENGDYLELELFEGGRLKVFTYTHDGAAETRDIPASAASKVVCDFYGRII